MGIESAFFFRFPDHIRLRQNNFMAGPTTLSNGGTHPMIDLLSRCNTNLATLGCCHGQTPCDCYQCLRGGFYPGMPDNYDCRKKLSYYVLNYGPSYASEIYHYLRSSQILEYFVPQGVVNILSLGCGFAPDLVAIDKYVQDHDLQLQVNYTGVDGSDFWTPSRYTTTTSEFHVGDVTQYMRLRDFDLIFVVKLFSTLYHNNQYDPFIRLMQEKVQNEMAAGSHLIFNDVNSIHTGRDVFHNSIRHNFRGLRQYFFGNPPYSEQSWVHLNTQQIPFNIPAQLTVQPLRDMRNTVIFEYRK